jgi:hypothetical protein
MRSKNFRFPVSTLVGARISNIVAMCRNHRVEPKYYGKLALTLPIAGILELANLWERKVWKRRIEAVRIEKPPVFVIGFWRSGTTLLHNLLCCDPEAAYTTTFQNVFPNSHLSQGWWLIPFTNVLLPARRPFDNVAMDMNFPQEEEFGMVNLQPNSLYNFFLFPRDFSMIVNNEMLPETFTDEELSSWKKAYHGLIAKAMVNTGGSRFFSKNPCNIARMTMLAEMFPGAKFIFIYRNPYQVAESFYRFILTIFPGVKLQDVPPDFTRETVIKFYADIMRRYLSTRDSLPASNLVEIRMEDFVQDKLGNLEKLYNALDLGPFDRSRACCEKYLADHAETDQNRYEIPEETYMLVDKYASDIIEKLGYRHRVPAMVKE